MIEQPENESERAFLGAALLDPWLMDRFGGRMTGGFLPGQMVVIGARPSIGKSAIGFQMARQAADLGHKALYVSIEMTNAELAARGISVDGYFIAHDILAQRLDDSDRAEILATAERCSIPLWVWSPHSATIERIAATLRCRQAAGGCDIVFIDYLSLITSNGKGALWERITDLSRGIKQMAKMLEIPVVVLSQVGRDSEKQAKDGKLSPPTLADLRYSGAVEQDADLVLFLHREHRRAEEAQLILAKGRNCELGIVRLHYQGRRFTFTEPELVEWTG